MSQMQESWELVLTEPNRMERGASWKDPDGDVKEGGSSQGRAGGEVRKKAETGGLL